MLIPKKPLFAIAIIALISCSGVMALSVQPQTSTSNNIRVACVGDSITFGFGYPESLQTKLGDDYTVNNFGVSASTVAFQSSKPYVKQSAYLQSKAFQPEIVIIMLGTNDAQSNINGGINTFSSDYKEIITEYQSLSTNPEIWLVTPPPIYDNDYYWDNTILEQQVIPQIKQVALELDLPTIDVNSALTDYPEYFGDGIHPNPEGASIITEIIFQAISRTG